jgi:hypothetical protein
MSAVEIPLSPVAELFGEFAASELPSNNHSNVLASSLVAGTGPA